MLVNRPLSAATRAITDMSTDATAFRFEKNDRAACLVFTANPADSQIANGDGCTLLVGASTTAAEYETKRKALTGQL